MLNAPSLPGFIRGFASLGRRKALFGLAALAVAGSAAAQGWPNRPITIVSPYAPGGTNDIVARLLGERLQRMYGQNVVVENRPGAAGIVGAQQVMRSAPDGYTLLSANNGALIVQAVVKSPAPYDPATAFTPLVKVADAPNYIGVSADLPVQSVAELIALARKEPGKLNYSSAGSGSFGNFMGEYFKMLTGVDIVHVPGKSSGPALTEMMAGRIQMMIDPIVLTQRSGGRVKVLATTHASRIEGLTDIPTIKESGGPEMAITGWFGLVGPASLPREVIEKIEAAGAALAADPEARKVLATAGIVSSHLGSAALTNLIREDLRRYTEVKQRARMVVE
jgi:tripartite-type tricarboxylate transporter receptor subunit TctC